MTVQVERDVFDIVKRSDGNGNILSIISGAPPMIAYTSGGEKGSFAMSPQRGLRLIACSSQPMRRAPGCSSSTSSRACR